MTLSEYLAALARKRFVYGETDCLMILADWVFIRRGIDPAAHWRGTYHDEAGCRAALIAGRGIVHCIEAGLAPLGIQRTSDPKHGDVGLVRTFIRRGDRAVLRKVGALCVSPNRWALMTDRGLVISEFQPVVAWSI
ncbi:MAG: hypothetical protein WBF99_06450 [Xanthobacteraceae bacterium]